MKLLYISRRLSAYFLVFTSNTPSRRGYKEYQNLKKLLEDAVQLGFNQIELDVAEMNLYTEE